MRRWPGLRGSISIALVFAVAGVLIPRAVHAAEQLDQSQSTITAFVRTPLAGSGALTQTFTAGIRGRNTKITLMLRTITSGDVRIDRPFPFSDATCRLEIGPSGFLDVSVRATDSSGLPSGVALGTTRAALSGLPRGYMGSSSEPTTSIGTMTVTALGFQGWWALSFIAPARVAAGGLYAFEVTQGDLALDGCTALTSGDREQAITMLNQMGTGVAVGYGGGYERGQTSGAGLAADRDLTFQTHVTVPPPPDVNGDTVVTSTDALCVLRYLGSFAASPACPQPLPRADTNEDGAITSTDALCVLRYLGGFNPSSACPVPPPALASAVPGEPQP